MIEAPAFDMPRVWAAHARFAPDRVAAICGDRLLTWGAFDRATNRVANALQSIGVQPEAPVALVMTNSIEMLEVMFGIIKAGACMVPSSFAISSSRDGSAASAAMSLADIT